MLERMDLFFDARREIYDEHMMKNIAGAREFYPFTAAQLPMEPGAVVLDLGCGTGLELGFYYEKNPKAKIVGIDLTKSMLEDLVKKFHEFAPELICGSYFEVPFGKNRFDGAVSVESLHHFTMEEKIPLYAKLHRALKENGWFVLTDYFAEDEKQEELFFAQLAQLRKEQHIEDGSYHFDTPLTVEHEISALKTAGFSHVEVLKNWGATHTIKARK